MTNTTNTATRIECPAHEGLPNGGDEYDPVCTDCHGTGYILCVNAAYTCGAFAVVVDGEPLCAGCLAEAKGDSTEAA